MSSLRGVRRPFCLAVLLAASVGLGPAVQAQSKAGTSAAQFLGLGISGRATAMGGAQVADARGAGAARWNPAALAGRPGSSAEFSHTDWFIDSQFQHAAVALDLQGAGHLGVNVTSFGYGEIEVTTIEQPDGTGERFSPGSLAFGVSYAHALTDRFAVGGTFKVIHESIKQMNATGAAVDLGVTYQTELQGLRLGMALTNFGSGMRMGGSDLRVPVDIDPGNSGNVDDLPGYLETNEWPLPLEFRLGLAFDALQTEQQRLTVSVDALAPYDDAQGVSAGAEWAFTDLFFVRGGYRKTLKEEDTNSGPSAGAGLQYRVSDRLALAVDYSVQWFEADAFGPPQMFTLSAQF